MDQRQLQEDIALLQLFFLSQTQHWLIFTLYGHYRGQFLVGFPEDIVQLQREYFFPLSFFIDPQSSIIFSWGYLGSPCQIIVKTFEAICILDQWNVIAVIISFFCDSFGLGMLQGRQNYKFAFEGYFIFEAVDRMKSFLLLEVLTILANFLIDGLRKLRIVFLISVLIDYPVAKTDLIENLGMDLLFLGFIDLNFAVGVCLMGQGCSKRALRLAKSDFKFGLEVVEEVLAILAIVVEAIFDQGSRYAVDVVCNCGLLTSMICFFNGGGQSVAEF